MAANFNPDRALRLAAFVEISPNNLDRQDAIFKLSGDASENFPEACRRLIEAAKEAVQPIRDALTDNDRKADPNTEVVGVQLDIRAARKLLELLTWEKPTDG